MWGYNWRDRLHSSLGRMRGSGGQINADGAGREVSKPDNTSCSLVRQSPSPPASLVPFSKIIKASLQSSREQIHSQCCRGSARQERMRGGGGRRTNRHKVEGGKRREKAYLLPDIQLVHPAETELLRMGHTMRNLAEMGLLKNRSAFICRPTPEEALKWGDSLDKLLTHKCK